MKCVVLGGNGFIGSNIVSTLIQRGYSVRSFDRIHTSQTVSRYISNPNLELVTGEFTDNSNIKSALDGCEVCFHLVSTTLPQSSNSNPVFDVESNVVGTLQLLENALLKNVRKVVFVSSGGTVYGVPKHSPIAESHPTDPVCSYGITKLAIEKYLSLFHTLHGLDYTILRLANPYGEGQGTLATQGAVAVFLGKALSGDTIEIWGDGSVVRDYIHISDVVESLILSIPPSSGARVFNIGSGRGYSLNEVISTIETVTQKKLVCSYKNSRVFDVPANVLNIDSAREILGWSPKIDFFTGIDRFSRWLQKL